MKKYTILHNLANLHLLNFCKEQDIDASGTYIHKIPRKNVYQLVKEDTQKPIASVCFNYSSVPTNTIHV